MGLADEPFPGKNFQQVYGTTPQATFGKDVPTRLPSRLLMVSPSFEAEEWAWKPNSGYPAIYDPVFPVPQRSLSTGSSFAISFDGGSNSTLLDPAAKLYTSTSGISLLSGMDIPVPYC